MQILCSQWWPDVWKPSTSHAEVHAEMLCQDFTQAAFTAAVFLPSVLSSVNEKRAWVD